MQYGQDAIDYVDTFWRKRWLILGGTLAGTLIAVGLTLTQDRVYRASAVMEVLPRPEEQRAPGSRFETYAAYVRNMQNLRAVLTGLALDRPPFSLDSGSLRDAVTVEPLPSTDLFRISVDLIDRTKARDAANLLAKQSVQFSEELNNRSTVDRVAYLQQQVTTAELAMATADRTLLAFRRSGALELAKRDLQVALEAHASLQTQVALAVKEVARLTPMVRVYAEKLKEQDRLVSLSRSILDDPLFREILARPTSTDLNALTVRSQQVNPLYEQVEPELVKALAELSGWNSIQQRGTQDLAKSPTLVGAIAANGAALEAEFNRLEREFTLAKDTYDLVAKQLAEANLLKTAKSGDIRVVDEAAEPTAPVRPRRTLNAILGGGVGLFASLFLSLLLVYLERSNAPALTPVLRRGGRVASPQRSENP